MPLSPAGFPGVTIQVSFDGGMSFSAYTVDVTASWANGAMTEVEKDVVLLVYGGPQSPDQLRSQRIQVLHDPPGLALN